MWNPVACVVNNAKLSNIQILKIARAKNVDLVNQY